MPWPTYSVEVAWSGRLTGVFTIGTSTIGGTDLIGGTFGGNVFDTITDDVREVHITRGRQSDMEYTTQGKCTLRLKDSNGTYNPENAGSSLANYLDVMKPVRVRAVYDGTTYDLFNGYISSIEHEPGRGAQVSTIEAVDFFEWLQMSKPTIATQTNKTVSYLIGLILDAVGLTSSHMRNLSTSHNTVPSWTADGSATALSLIEGLLEIDRGVFYVAKDGRATYVDHGTLYSSAVLATITGAEVGSLRARIDKDQVINGQTVTRTGGVAQTYTDATSRRLRGYREGSSIESAYLATDSQALILAKWLVNLLKQPRGTPRRVRLSNKDATNLEQILARELGDVVAIDESVGGTDVTGHTWQIEHNITSSPRLHECWWTVQKRQHMFFTIGRSLIGGTDVIGY
ncbi:MAG: hypothetical protein V2A73_08640 [Pseudomonadota bacterium]